MVRSRVLLSAVIALLGVGLAGCDETGVYSSSGFVAPVYAGGYYGAPYYGAPFMAVAVTMAAGTATVAASTGAPDITTAAIAVITEATTAAVIAEATTAAVIAVATMAAAFTVAAAGGARARCFQVEAARRQRLGQRFGSSPDLIRGLTRPWRLRFGASLNRSDRLRTNGERQKSEHFGSQAWVGCGVCSGSWPGLTRPSTRTPQPPRKRLN